MRKEKRGKSGRQMKRVEERKDGMDLISCKFQHLLLHIFLEAPKNLTSFLRVTLNSEQNINSMLKH